MGGHGRKRLNLPRCFVSFRLALIPRITSSLERRHVGFSVEGRIHRNAWLISLSSASGTQARRARRRVRRVLGLLGRTAGRRASVKRMWIAAYHAARMVTPAMACRRPHMAGRHAAVAVRHIRLDEQLEREEAVDRSCRAAAAESISTHRTSRCLHAVISWRWRRICRASGSWRLGYSSQRQARGLFRTAWACRRSDPISALRGWLDLESPILPDSALKNRGYRDDPQGLGGDVGVRRVSAARGAQDVDDPVHGRTVVAHVGEEFRSWRG